MPDQSMAMHAGGLAAAFDAENQVRLACIMAGRHADQGALRLLPGSIGRFARRTRRGIWV